MSSLYVPFLSGGKFDPSKVSGLQYWFSPRRETSFNDGDGIDEAQDFSGNNLVSTQGTASKQPSYETNEINGHAVASFDNTDDWLTIGDNLDSGTEDFTLFIVMRDLDVTERIWQKRGTGAFGAATGWLVMSSTADDLLNTAVDAGDGTYAKLSATTYALGDGNPHIITLAWENSSGNLDLYVDNDFKETAAKTGDPSGKDITTSRECTLGSYWNSDIDTGQPYEGDLGDVLFYNRYLPIGDINRLNIHLANLYNISI